MRITVAVPDELATWVRAHAAERGTSLSAMLRQMLEERMHQELGYAEAMRSFLTRERRPLSLSGRYPKREELYDREVCRHRDKPGP